MYTRDKQFYDLVGGALASIGLTGPNALSMFIDSGFADKYNSEAIFSQMGFPMNPDIPINPTFLQIEASIRPYTMAGYVDIDSDGPTKSTESMTLKTGGLPTFKHEYTIDRKIMREKLMLSEMMGGATDEIYNVVLQLLFNALDDLLGGNYNTVRYQRNQIVSNEGKLVINATNNPLGIPLEIDFGVPSKNITTSQWYSKNGSGNVTQETAVGTSIDPIKVMKDVKRKATDSDFMPQGHWECDKVTFDDLLGLPYFRKLYAVANRPDITDQSQQLAFGNLVNDAQMKAFIESSVGAPITVVDEVASVESFDTKSKKMKYTNLRSFNEGVLVYVPDGDLGDVQFGRPVAMETPGARIGFYDGGRTLIRQVFDDEHMTQTVKSEVTALVVPNKTRWFYYLKVKK